MFYKNRRKRQGRFSLGSFSLVSAFWTTDLAVSDVQNVKILPGDTFWGHTAWLRLYRLETKQSKILFKNLKTFRFSLFLASDLIIWVHLTWTSDSSSRTAYVDGWKCLECQNLMHGVTTLPCRRSRNPDGRDPTAHWRLHIWQFHYGNSTLAGLQYPSEPWRRRRHRMSLLQGHVRATNLSTPHL